MSEVAIPLRTKQRQQTRAEIVRLAFDLFARNGYENVSVETIAAAAGVSRATLFNYFPQKELILRDIASSRVARLKAILDEVAQSGTTPTFDHLAQIILKLCEENARITLGAKTLLLQVIFRQFPQGTLLSAREQFIDALADVIGRIRFRRKVEPRLIAETLFTVYIATTLEWLMRTDVRPQWLPDTMRDRLQVVLGGLQ